MVTGQLIERGGHKPVNEKRWSQVSSREEVVTGQLIKRGSHRSVHGKNWSRQFTGRAGHRSRKKGETRMTTCILKQNPNTLNKIKKRSFDPFMCLDLVTGRFTRRRGNRSVHRKILSGRGSCRKRYPKSVHRKMS